MGVEVRDNLTKIGCEASFMSYKISATFYEVSETISFWTENFVFQNGADYPSHIGSDVIVCHVNMSYFFLL